MIETEDLRAAVFGPTIYDEAVVEVFVKDEAEDERAKLFGHTLNDDGTLRCVSPSQHKTHKRCKRAWFYDKVMKLPRKKKSKGAQLGTECHGRMEKFLKTGADIRGPLERFGDEMIRPYLDRAPFNGGDMLVEAPLLDPQLVTPGGIRISGFSDVTLPPIFESDGSAEDIDSQDRRMIVRPVVIDHKFKKKLKQYADTAEQLAAGDPQAIIYPTWALTKWPEATSCEFRHHNHQTESARLNLPVSITDSREVVFEKWRKLGKYIDTEMAATALKKTPDDVEAAGDTDPSACRAFGGCDFLSVCSSSPHNRFVNGLATGTLSGSFDFGNRRSEPSTTQGYDLMGLLDEMEDAPTGALAATAPAASSAAPSGGVPAKLAQLEAQDCKPKGVYMLKGGAVAQFKEVVGDRAIFKNKEKQLVECGLEDTVTDLNGDPVATKLFESKVRIVDMTTTPDRPADTTPAITQAAGIVPKDAPADTNPPKETPTPAVTTSAPVQATTTATVAPTTAAATTTATTPPATEQTPAKVKRGPKPKVAGDQLIILVNNSCPAAEDLMPYVQGMCDALAKKAGIADVRLAEKGSDLAYGAWKAMLTVVVKTNPPPAGLYVIQRTELSEPVIEALSTLAVVSYGGR